MIGVRRQCLTEDLKEQIYYRGKGVGVRLMEYALKYGRDKACPFAFVETMSFSGS